MGPASKTQYLGYHSAFDLEEGFIVPLSAFEKQHRRERHRPATRPGAHGGERLSRHHARPHVARCHSWPAAEDDAAGFEEKPAPPLPSREARRRWAEVGARNPQAPPAAEGRPAAAGKWAAFSGRLAAEAPGEMVVQRWPRRSAGAPAAPAPATAVGAIRGAQHMEAVDDRLVDARTARMAARLLPMLLESAGLVAGEISLVRLKVLLESAISSASLGGQRVAVATAEQAGVPRDGQAGEAWRQTEESDIGGRDLRAKGWMKIHKSGHSAKKMEQVSFKSAQRLAQSEEAIGYFSADEQDLGKSWTLYDKARSKQHGGASRFKRATSDRHQ